MEKSKKYWGKTLVSFLVVLCAMPLGHAFMILMERFLPPVTLHYAAFALGAAGLALVIVGVFVKGDTRQTLLGLFGGLLFWTGWVEFLLQYYANRYGVQPEIVDGEIVTKPEYLIMPATFGFWMLIMMMWACYLLLMFCYDSNFLGDRHPVTFLIGLGCLVGAVFMFIKELKIAAWGANIRMAIATVIVFWTPVEIMGRNDLFNEIWVNPSQHVTEMVIILAVFVLLAAYLIYKSLKNRSGYKGENKTAA